MLQLFLLGIVNFWEKQTQNRILGIFILLIILSMVKAGFWISFKNSAFYWILGGPHELLFGPVLFMYLLCIRGDQKSCQKPHLLYSLAVYLVIHPIRILIFGSDASPHISSLLYMLVTIVFITAYLFNGIQLIKNDLRNRLKNNQVIRISLFFGAINLFFLIKMLIKSPLVINQLYQNSAITVFNKDYTFPVYLFIGKVIFVWFCLALIYYMFTEIHGLKKHFLRPALAMKPTPVDFIKINQLQDRLLSNEFSTQELNLHGFLNENQLDRATLKTFLESNGYSNFSELVNAIRIRNFKEKLWLEENHKFDLLSLAMESGFKSKASFYRTFKNSEGVTPSEYINRLKSIKKNI